jgi:AcrR family transcriptional regulator
MPTQEERSEATRTKLLAVARELFGRRGYAATAIDDVTGAAGLTKGAFYHHFADKQAIFRAVFEETERKLLEAAAAVKAPDAWRRFRAGCRAFLEASIDPAVQRIAFHDAPAVLGWETWREIDAKMTLGLIEGGLQAAMAEGDVRVRSPATLARLIFGTLCEGGRMVAAAPEPRKALDAVMREVDALLAGLATHRRSDRSARAPTRGAGRRRDR